MSLVKGREAKARLVCEQHLSVQVSRDNILLLGYLVRLERRGIFTAVSLEKEDANVRLRNGAVASIPFRLLELMYREKIEVVSGDTSDLCVELKGHNCCLAGPKQYLVDALLEMFSGSYYEEVDVTDAVVVDVGGYIGDTAIHFALRGAKVVYVYEPSPEFLEIARRNVSQYDNILLYGYGLGSEDRVDHLAGFGSCRKTGSTIGEEVEIRKASTVLLDIIRKEGNIGLLKIDCEGCEWELVNCLESDILNRVAYMYIEVHRGNHDLLLEKLRKHGFEVKRKKTPYAYPELSAYLLRKS
jgi:FkbM family methyltransferase